MFARGHIVQCTQPWDVQSNGRYTLWLFYVLKAKPINIEKRILSKQYTSGKNKLMTYITRLIGLHSSPLPEIEVQIGIDGNLVQRTI